MQTDLSRRALLRGKVRGDFNAFFPPWSVKNFTDQCARCDECLEACEENILVKGDGGYPNINFMLGECTFCQQCASACKYQAFNLSSQQPWYLKASVNDQCLALNSVICRSCSDFCEQKAIAFELKTGGRATPVISESLCNGCGACYSACPTMAIQMKEAR